MASYIMLPKVAGGVLGMGGAATVSLGASGAVFGLFAISVLTKLRFDFRKLLEAVILGQFVIERFLSEAKMAAGGLRFWRTARPERTAPGRRRTSANDKSNPSSRG